jgi:hypothetical protein
MYTPQALAMLPALHELRLRDAGDLRAHLPMLRALTALRCLALEGCQLGAAELGRVVELTALTALAFEGDAALVARPLGKWRELAPLAALRELFTNGRLGAGDAGRLVGRW